jgi:hypothetical protein
MLPTNRVVAARRAFRVGSDFGGIREDDAAADNNLHRQRPNLEDSS